jgi:hypothetical protein
MEHVNFESTKNPKEFNWRDTAPAWLLEALLRPSGHKLDIEVAKLDDVATLAHEQGVEFNSDDDTNESNWIWQVDDGLITQAEMDYGLSSAKKYGTAYAKMISWGCSQGLLTQEEGHSFLGQL